MNWVGKVTYNEAVVLFFTDSKECRKLAVSSTGGLTSGVGNSFFVPHSIGIVAGREGPFNVFVLLLNLA